MRPLIRAIVLILATSTGLPADSAGGVAVGQAEAIGGRILEALEARLTTCEFPSGADVRICGVTQHNAATLQDRIVRIIREAQEEGREVAAPSRHGRGSEWVWLLKLDEVSVKLTYSEESGTVSMVLTRPLAWCRAVDHELDPEVLVIRDHDPLYPELAKAARIPARVEVEVHAGSQGAVPRLCVRSTSPPNLGFEDCAVKAVENELLRRERMDGSFVADVWFEIPASITETLGASIDVPDTWLILGSLVHQDFLTDYPDLFSGFVFLFDNFSVSEKKELYSFLVKVAGANHTSETLAGIWDASGAELWVLNDLQQFFKELVRLLGASLADDRTGSDP